MRLRCVIAVMGALAVGGIVRSSELSIKLAGSEAIAHQTTEYQCDVTGTKLGLPASTFSVDYFNGGGNSLAVLPIGGKSLIFANVMSGSGARYAAQQYIWWEAGSRGITLYSDSLSGKMQSTCRRVEKK